VVKCAVRGPCVVVGLRDSPVPWGTSKATVSHWRRRLGIEDTEGSRRLRRLHALSEAGEASRAKAVAQANSPPRRAKISAATQPGQALAQLDAQSLRRPSARRFFP
jgi:hypothetical protein